MGNKLSIVSATSSRCSSSTKSRNIGQSSRDRKQSVTHIPKHLKPAKPLKKHQRERLEKQHLKQQLSEGSGHVDGIGIAVPYQPYMIHMDQQQQQNHHHDTKINNNDNNIIVNPPFDYLQNGTDVVMNVQQQQQNNDEFEGNVTTINNDGAKTAFQWFEGRRYQNQDDAAILPNDQRELDRLRVLNYILRWAFEGDVVAPVKSSLLDGTHVLSVGCGPGIWLGHPVIDFALDYKKSHFTAVDILDLLPDQDMDHSYDKNASAHQQANQSYFDFLPLHPMLPTTMTCSTWHQQNLQHHQQQHISSSHSHPSQDTPVGCPINDHSTLSLSDQTTSTSSFSGVGSSSTHSTLSKTIRSRSVFDNLDIFAIDVREYGLPFDNDSFEFVMQRLSTPAYTNDQWKRVVGELIRVTRPGGYLQFIEIDYNSQNLGPAGQAWQEKLCEVLAKTRKLNPFMASQIDTVLEEQGLVNVEKKKISMPFGSWGLDIGVLWQQNLEAFIEASSPAFSMALGISAAECKVMWQGYKDELDFVKAFTNVYAVTGQKPHLVV